MGGHGGLNILPQKKWNVYRKDVQFKVHFDENKIIKETQEKIAKKNEREFESKITELKSNIDVNVNKFQKECKGEHINLFAEEEKEITKRNKKHQEYLIKAGHYIYNNTKFDGTNCIYDKQKETQVISDFTKMKNCEEQWFLSRQKNKIFQNIYEHDENGNDSLNKRDGTDTDDNSNRPKSLKGKLDVPPKKEKNSIERVLRKPEEKSLEFKKRESKLLRQMLREKLASKEKRRKEKKEKRKEKKRKKKRKKRHDTTDDEGSIEKEKKRKRRKENRRNNSEDSEKEDSGRDARERDASGRDDSERSIEEKKRRRRKEYRRNNSEDSEKSIKKREGERKYKTKRKGYV